jgi:predicted Fe-S protein YdhL (DUF1289 family)
MPCKSCKKDRLVCGGIEKSSNGAYVWVDVNGKKQSAICQECKNNSQKEKRRNSEERRKKDRSYELTPKGFIMRVYRNMKSRVSGVQKQKHHLYKGKYLLGKEDFYKWALSTDSKFHDLFLEYITSERDRKKAPSVDRIDSSRGYEIDNMEWVTHSENSRRGHASRYNL